MNPGLVSHFVKQALLNLAADLLPVAPKPASGGNRQSAGAWASGRSISPRRDTQTSLTPKQPGEFVNTWSIEGFAGEACQPAELGRGGHGHYWPASTARS